MAHQIKTSIQHIPAEPGQRILAVSDIHGHRTGCFSFCGSCITGKTIYW